MKRHKCVTMWFTVIFLLVAGPRLEVGGTTTLLSEDFNDGVADGFTEIGDAWDVDNGQYLQFREDPPGRYRSWVSTLPEYTLEVDIRPLSGQQTKVIYAHADIGEDYRVDFWPNQSRLCMPAWGEGWSTRTFEFGGLSLTYGQTYRLKVEVSRAGVKVLLDGVRRHDESWEDGIPLGDGKVGVGTYSGAARFDNLLVSNTQGTPLLWENFDDHVADGFTEIGDTWDFDEGQYLQFAEDPPGPWRSWAAAISEYVVEVDCTPVSGYLTNVIYAHGDSTEDYRFDFSLTGSRLTIPKWGESWLTRTTTLGGLNLSYEHSYRVKIEVSTAGVKVWLDGQLRHDEPWVVGPALGDGTIALGTWAAYSRFDNVRVSLGTGVAGKTWYVDGLVPASGNGSSWQQAFKAIQEGIDAASPGDTVIVADWTYSENIDFKGKDITLRSTDPLDRNVIADTIIDGRSAAQAVTFQGTETESCILSGFTIQSGNSPYGGGVMGHNSKATIRHNVITDNSANAGGGVAFCDGPIQNNSIASNMAQTVGGGLYSCNGPIQNNTISYNQADQDGGGLAFCPGTIADNFMEGNSAGRDGGGLYSCQGAIQSNVITGNAADIRGGGLSYCHGTIQSNTIIGNEAPSGGGLASCNGVIENNVIEYNGAADSGGGLFSCDGMIQNNTIIGNSAGYGGGLYGCQGAIRNNVINGNGVYRWGGGLAHCGGPIQNNVITGNSAVWAGGLDQCFGTIQNCIIWGNSAPTGPQLLLSSVPTYSCIQDWTGGGEGNITGDPQFVDADGSDNDPDTYEDNNYRLKPGSPCIDTGKNALWMWGAVDLDGNNRIFNGGKSATVDMGAYEYGSFRFNIVKVEETPANQVKLTWTSRPNDTYFVYSSESPSAFWRYEATVLSQGERTTWTGSTTTVPGRFYYVALE